MFVGEPDRMPYTNGSGSPVSVGDVIVAGDRIGIVVEADVADGDEGILRMTGVEELDATSGEAWDQGDEIYWDAVTEALTTEASGNTKAGYAWADKASADTVARVALNK